ncbi:glycosyltransferase [Pengzhenrongella frigida]|uniref:Glycosyltransferase n=2 Tax=Pengzhenrongella frigida TaxID=1259133 RepID=A0A4Q5MYJ0_9MICO|nr:glycosyltransferase [Cellulomonas sp. HLT2-17]
MWRRNQHLVAGLLRARPRLRVLFVEPPADPLHALIRRGPPRRGDGLRPGPPLDGVGDGRLWLLQLTKPLPRRLDPHADRRLARGVQRASRRLGMKVGALWVNDPSAAAWLEVTAWPALYDITDDWTAAHRNRAEAERLVANERLLLDRCVEVTVCSPALAERKQGCAPTTLITNGVDLALYRTPAPRPADLPAGRLVVYVGTIHRDRFDVDACAATARALTARGTSTKATVVLVGPALLDAVDDQALRSAGVVVLGPRPFDSVPAYLQHADVLLVPHIVDAFTDSLDPLKLYEYRAVGRPVVSTPVAGFRDSTSALVTTVPAAAFGEAVADVLERTPRGAGLGPVDGDVPTWDTQVTRFGDVLDRLRRPVPTRP